MESSKISVIVPVYNAEKYIEECIQSVIVQDYKNWELVLVNDGSTDASGEICDKISSIDHRIKVIHQENQGVTKARANGFFSSTGEYIYFIDADDFIERDTLGYMLSLFKEGVDIVVSDCKDNMNLSWEEYAQCLLKHELLAVFMKLYRRRLFDEYVFDTPRYFRCGEDFLMQLRILKNICGTIFCDISSKYHYRYVADSVSKTFIPDMEYEIKLMRQVSDIIRILPASTKLNYAHFKFEISYLGGMIGLRYPIPFNEQWVVDIVEKSKNYRLTLHEKIAVGAVKWSPFRFILITEKRLRRFYRRYVKRL